MKIQFTEEQKFDQWWIFIPVGLAGLIPLFGIYKQMVLGEPFGNKPMSNWGLIVFLLIEIGILLLFWRMTLKTHIDEEGIQITFVPFLKKKFAWKDIQKAEIVNYGFVGGWGIRLGTKYGTVYNTKGNKGLFILLNNGKKYCIGTQKEDELGEIIKEACQLLREKPNW